MSLTTTRKRRDEEKNGDCDKDEEMIGMKDKDCALVGKEEILGWEKTRKKRMQQHQTA